MPRCSLLLSLLTLILVCSALAASEPASRNSAQCAAATDRFGDPLPPFALARLGTSRYRVTPRAVDAVLSSDGKTIGVVTEDSIILMDAQTGKQIRRLFFRQEGAFHAALSPDGSAVAAWADDDPITLWDAKSGRVIAERFYDRRSWNRNVIFSGDGSVAAILARADGQRFVTTFDPKSGKEHPRAISLRMAPSEGAAISADGKMLATWGRVEGIAEDEAVQFWDLATRRRKVQVRLDNKSRVLAAAFSPNGGRFAVFTANGTLRLFGCSDGQQIYKKAPKNLLWLRSRDLLDGAPLIFSADGSRIALGRSDGIVQVWDADSGEPLSDRQSPIAGLQFFAFPAGRVIACGVVGNSVRFWDEASGKVAGFRDGHAGRVASLVFSSDRKTLHSVAETGDLIDWDVRSTTPVRIAMLESDKPTTTRIARGRWSARFAATSGGKYVAFVAADGVRLWDTATQHVVQTFPNVRSTSPVAAFAGHGDLLALANGRVNFCDVPDGSVRVSLSGLSGPVRCATGSSDGRYVAAAAVHADRANSTVDVTEIRVWRAEDGQQLSDLSVHHSFPSGADANQALALSPDGRLLAAVASDAVEVWETATGQRISRLAAGEGKPGPLCFSPDGRLLAIGRTWRDTETGHSEVRRGTTQLWEMASHTVRRDFRGHDGGVTALAFSTDGRRLASGSANSTILIWDAAGEMLLPHPESKLTAAQGDALWQQLASADGATGYKAILGLCAAPGDGINLLKSRVRPIAAGLDEQEIRRLVKSLDSPKPTERALAEAKLACAAQTAVPALKRVIKDSVSADLRKRAEALLMQILLADQPDDWMRLTRALEFLERIATPQARELVRSVALGRADHPLTLEAKSVLARMQGQR